jgi:hypothetical protein
MRSSPRCARAAKAASAAGASSPRVMATSTTRSTTRGEASDEWKGPPTTWKGRLVLNLGTSISSLAIRSPKRFCFPPSRHLTTGGRWSWTACFGSCVCEVGLGVGPALRGEDERLYCEAHYFRVKCGYCGESIRDGAYVEALNRQWHEHHLRCAECEVELPADGIYEDGRNRPVCAEHFAGELRACGGVNDMWWPDLAC